jgi:hypothetical protein
MPGPSERGVTIFGVDLKLPGMLHGTAPDPGVPELFHEFPVELPADVLDGGVLPEDHGFFQVAAPPWGFMYTLMNPR